MSAASGSRMTHVQAILGPELAARLPDTKVLLVGAGGIGCELLKNLVLTGFGHITLLDLDTIDLSNLNRQFLFRKKDIKNSKAIVAAQTAGAFNPNVKIYPIHGNIKEAQFDVAWFQQFDIVLNALDNVDARRHVNKMCMAGGIPLVESGTAGYLGQVQPILKDRTECFDCIPKPTQKTFPVCTIRSTPSQPIHCIVWAKSYLLSQLFGEDEDATGQGDLDEALKDGENAQEIAKLRQEQQAFKAVREALRSADTAETAARMTFEKVFNSDVKNLLSMADMWAFRDPPVPLDYASIKAGTFVLRDKPATQANGHTVPALAKGSSVAETLLHNGLNGMLQAAPSSSKLRDQRALSLQEVLTLFVASTDRLATRLRAGEETISFDKDDDDTLDFVTAAANLRSAAYGIAGKSRWEIKEMAGNIIPAIATTNAIISGLIVLQALHLLRKTYTSMRSVHIQFKATAPLATVNPTPPQTTCGICRDTYISIRADPERATLGEVVRAVLGEGDGDGTGEREVSVYEGQRLLMEPDWDDNAERTLASLDCGRGKFITIVDDEDEWGTVAVAVGVLPGDYPADGPAFIVPSHLPVPPRKAKPAPVAPTTPSRKRGAPDEEDDEIAVLDGPPAPKRARTTPDVLTSPSKRRRLEEDGVLLLESQDDKLEDEVIVVD